MSRRNDRYGKENADAPGRSCFGCLVLVFISAFVYSFLFDECSCAGGDGSSRDKYEVRNGAFDNSVWQVERYLKKNLRDPDSYEGIAWSKVVKDGDTYSVRHKYRAKNRMGGYTIVEARFRIDEYGNVIDCTVISEY